METKHDDYAGLKGHFYRSYIRRPRLARVVGATLWGSDFRPLYRHLERLAELPAHTTVLDAACGAGLALAWLDPTRGHRYLGVDLSPSMLEEAQRVADRRGLTDVELHVGDINALPLDDGVAQVALVYNALHCLGDPAGALREVGRCLSDGGTVLGSSLVRGESNRADRLLALDPGMGPGGTAEELRGWLGDAGFGHIELETSGAMATFSARR